MVAVRADARRLPSHRARRVSRRAGWDELDAAFSHRSRRAHEANEHAAEALAISALLYRDGLDNYLSVSVAQVQALAAELVGIQLRVRQVQASVSLIRALGGGWSTAVGEQRGPIASVPFKSHR
jgi:outer membrane protein TolC